MIGAQAGTRRSARLVVALAMIGATACVLPFAGVRLGPWPFFLPAFLVAVVLSESVTSFLLMQQYLVRGDARMLGLAATYLFSAAVVVAYGVTGPGVVAAHGLLGATPSTTLWLSTIWHAGFPVGLALSMAPLPSALRLQPLEPGARRFAVVVLAASVPLAVGAATSFMIADAGSLPALVRGDDYRALTRTVGVPVLALEAVALGLLTWRGDRGEAVQRWLPLTALAAFCDSILVYVAGYRWSAGWYAGRVMSTVAAGVILVVLLHQVTALYRRLWDAHEQLIEESRHDFLTALLTRREGLRRTAALLQQAHRHNFPVSAALLDVDHFKAVNDVHGHAVGDRVLVEVAARVRASLRAGDFAFRFGGEEFAILFAHASEEEALEACWRILRTIRLRPVRTGEGMVSVTASVGVAELVGEEPVDQLLERADQALYEAKRSGRDRARGHHRLILVERDA